jgi:hypothetical protein
VWPPRAAARRARYGMLTVVPSPLVVIVNVPAAVFGVYV